jgi:hypothetical protein
MYSLAYGRALSRSVTATSNDSADRRVGHLPGAHDSRPGSNAGNRQREQAIAQRIERSEAQTPVGSARQPAIGTALASLTRTSADPCGEPDSKPPSQSCGRRSTGTVVRQRSNSSIESGTRLLSAAYIAACSAQPKPSTTRTADPTRIGTMCRPVVRSGRGSTSDRTSHVTHASATAATTRHSTQAVSMPVRDPAAQRLRQSCCHADEQSAVNSGRPTTGQATGRPTFSRAVAAVVQRVVRRVINSHDGPRVGAAIRSYHQPLKRADRRRLRQSVDVSGTGPCTRHFGRPVGHAVLRTGGQARPQTGAARDTRAPLRQTIKARSRAVGFTTRHPSSEARSRPDTCLLRQARSQSGTRAKAHSANQCCSCSFRPTATPATVHRTAHTSPQPARRPASA